jgi:hypothetical protein
VQNLKRLMLPTLMLSGGLLIPGAAQAATRTFTVTDFDTIRLEAPIAVAVQAQRSTTARGEGDADLLQRIDLNVQGRVLTIRLKSSPFQGRRADATSSARLFLTAPALRRARLSGSGTLAIDGMKAQSAEIASSGSGMVSVANLTSDTLLVTQQGSGALRISGRTANATVQLAGSGAIDAAALTVTDLDVSAQGAGAVQALATRSAKVVAIGPVAVTVGGQPACTVRHAGSGPVICGGKDF